MSSNVEADGLALIKKWNEAVDRMQKARSRRELVPLAQQVTSLAKQISAFEAENDVTLDRSSVRVVSKNSNRSLSMNDPLSRDVSRRRGEPVPTLSLGRSPYPPQFGVLAAAANDILSRLRDAERALSKISTAATERDDTAMMSNVSKGNAAVATIKKAAQILISELG